MEERYQIGYHGETRGLISGRLRGSEIYLAHDPALARCYAEGDPDARVLKVAVEAEQPLVFDSSTAFRDAWHVSGCDSLQAPNFHPATTSHFCAWARAQGYDAIVLPEEIFEDEIGFEWCASTFGEPQTIVLDPAKARIVGVL